MSICACGFSTPTYTASSVIQLQDSSAGGPQQQAAGLLTDALILRVIKDLNLEQIQDAPGGRRSLVNAFRAHMKVQVIPNTHRLRVDYTDRDPNLASAVVNHLVDVISDDKVAVAIKVTNLASPSLKDQLSELRQENETLQSKFVALQMTNEFVDPDLRGKPVIYTSTLARLQRSTVVLAQARMNRVLKASVADVVATRSPRLIAQLSGTSIAGVSSEPVRASMSRIQGLLEQQEVLQTQTHRSASRKGLQHSLTVETKLAAQRAQADLAAAAAAEQALRAENEVDRTVALQLNDRSIDYAVLPTEQDQNRWLYQGLLTRLRRAGMLEVTVSPDLTVVTRASASSSHSNSRAALYLALGGGFGVIFGCCLALLVDAVENTKKRDEQGWSLHVNGSYIPPIRGMNSTAFRLSQGRPSLVLTQRKKPVALRRTETVEIVPVPQAIGWVKGSRK